MLDSDSAAHLEDEIGAWRDYLGKRQAIHTADVDELEDHLRAQLAQLIEAGLAADEAFLIAVKRVGDLDAVSREFAREHSERLWKQLVVGGTDASGSSAARKDGVVAISLAVAAAALIKLPALFGITMSEDAGFYGRNLSLFVLPVLAAYFAWKRGLEGALVRRIAAVFVVAAVVANAFPFVPGGSTEALTALHLPIALWLTVGLAYAGHRWKDGAARMDFIRFSGEFAIYYVLIALGGGVLMAFMAMIFQAIGIDVEPFFESWLLPCGAVGAVIIASWLVEAKQAVIENMAPVLTRLFTPLFAVALITFLGAVAWTGRGVDISRDVLIAFDLLLAVVLALLLYSASARDRQSPPGLFDVLQVVLVVSALLADAVALWAIAARITEFGFTPNRVAALGENLVLLVNLGWSAVLYTRFLRNRGPFSAVERWQTSYVPVYGIWAAIVVVVFPLLFGFS
ncbi:MAG: permease prefix domain 1-containing protein [Coriobacteriales bacterium]